jgi:hypothetical protein
MSNQQAIGFNSRLLTAIVCLVLVFLATAVTVSCNGPPEPPPTDTPPQQPATTPPSSQPPSQPQPSSDGWKADSVIEQGEYDKSLTYGDVELHWTSDEQYIHIGLKAKTTGWVALGIQPGTTMKDSDMILGLVQDGTVEIHDQFSTGTYGPHRDDTDLGGTDDIIEYNGKEDDGFTIIEFKRKLDTGDTYDLPLSAGINKIIWAYGSQDSADVKHRNRGYGEIDL